MKSKTTIRKHLRELRQLIENTDDPLERQIAYAMETAVRWATEETVGWPGLREEAKAEARILAKELEQVR